MVLCKYDVLVIFYFALWRGKVVVVYECGVKDGAYAFCYKFLLFQI